MVLFIKYDNGSETRKLQRTSVSRKFLLTNWIWLKAKSRHASKKREWAPSLTCLVYCTSEPNHRNTRLRIFLINLKNVFSMDKWMEREWRKKNLPHWVEIVSLQWTSDKVLIKKTQMQKHHKMFHLSCLHTSHLLPSISFLILSALPGQQSLCASPDKCLALISGTQSGIRQQGHKRTKEPSDYCIMLKGTEVNIYVVFLLYHFCQKAWPPEVWCGRTGTLGIWDYTLYDPPRSQMNGDFSPLSGKHTPTPLRMACIFLGTDHMSFILLWDPSVASKQRTTRLSRMKTNLLRVLHSDKAPLTHTNPSRTQLARHSSRTFSLEKAGCRAVSKNRA